MSQTRTISEAPTGLSAQRWALWKHGTTFEHFQVCDGVNTTSLALFNGRDFSLRWSGGQEAQGRDRGYPVPVLVLLNEPRSLTQLEESLTDAEAARWQQAIDKVVLEFDPDRDGSGTDSGDPLDLTLAELRAAFEKLKDSRTPVAPPDEVIPMTMVNRVKGGTEAECRAALGAIYELLHAEIQADAPLPSLAAAPPGCGVFPGAVLGVVHKFHEQVMRSRIAGEAPR